MVVTVVLGVLSTGAMLSLNANSAQKAHKLEANRLNQLLRLAADEALLNLDIIGVHVLSDGYAFYKRKKDEDNNTVWEAFDADGRMRQRKLPEGITLDLELEAQAVVLNSAEEQQEEDDPLTPHLWLLPDGETLPQYKFKVLQDEAKRVWEIERNVEGGFKLTPVLL